MSQCPKCRSYMAFNMRYNAGYLVVEYSCSCGYSTSYEHYTIDNKTYINKNNSITINYI